MDLQQISNDYLIPWLISFGLAAAIFIIGRWFCGLITKAARHIFIKMKLEDILINFLCSIISALLTLVVIVAALNQLGVDTSSLVALMAAAGLAIGLALQGSLQNFAAGVLLLIFKPFKAGNFVEVAGCSGSVETIGIFTTTLITPDNREVIIPNGSIYSDSITNYSAKATRRIDMSFGIGYGDDIKAAKALLDEIVKNDPRVLHEPACQIALSELGDSSVNFIVRPWVKSADYWNAKFDITEAVKLGFDKQGISIPFPQMDVHVQKQEAS